MTAQIIQFPRKNSRKASIQDYHDAMAKAQYFERLRRLELQFSKAQRDIDVFYLHYQPTEKN